MYIVQMGANSACSTAGVAGYRTDFQNNVKVEKYRIPIPIWRFYLAIPIANTEPTSKYTEKLIPTSNTDTDPLLIV